MKQALDLGALLFGHTGRIGRAAFVWSALAALVAWTLAVPLAERLAPRAGIVALDLVALWVLSALAAKRLKDRGRSPWALLVAVVPVLGLLWLFVELALRKGSDGENHYGPDPRDGRRVDYLRVGSARENVVEDVTRLYATPVFAVARPTTVEEVIEAVTCTDGPLSIGGGRFSMGGQVASPGSLHLDMRALNRVLAIDLGERTVRVQAGVRWCDLQAALDPHDLSVKIMQTYANFTVGGSLSVNCHGRYVGLGPLVLSVREIELVLASGERVVASPKERRELFYGAIGGYGGLGVIVEAVLELAVNTRVAQRSERMPTEKYTEHFRRSVRDDREAIFHNADLYVPECDAVNAVTWVETKRPVTTKARLMAPQKAYPLFAYLFWAVSETPLGRWRRRYLIEPLFYLSSRVHWRNYEAGYDAGELEPPARDERTYVLQEYFVPIDRLGEFVPRLREILTRHRVNMLNVSIRHALPDPGTMLAWAREECFAFVCYYKQRTRENAKDRVAVWTRELIDAALASGGTYYLPYQPHATAAQFHAAYPRAHELFALKGELDPGFRFRGAIYDRYYAPTLGAADSPTDAGAEEEMARRSEFRAVFDDVALHDALYLFLQNVFHLYPEDRFFTLLREATEERADDATIYRVAQERLPTIKPLLSELTYALPSLRVQKAEMARQTAELLAGRRGARIDGYAEIGTTGRYVNALSGALPMGGDVILVHDVAPGNGPVDVLERGQLSVLGRFVPIADYAPIAEDAIADASVDLVTCYIGLHHARPETVEPFLRSIHRVLRPGGVFVLRDHDVTNDAMRTFVSLIHTVFNLGLGESWATNSAERRHFAPVATWVERIEAVGLRDLGPRLLQPNDPSKNVLLAFERPRDTDAAITPKKNKAKKAAAPTADAEIDT